MASRRVLILTDRELPSMIKHKSWLDFIDDEDDIELYVFGGTGALSEQEQLSPRIHAYKEVDGPYSDATLELWAWEMHKKHAFTHIYTNEEELLIRAAHLRSLLKIKTGLSKESVRAFREKAHMKQIASKGEFPVPPFASLYTASDLISFIEKHGYPVVIKPTLGVASSGIHLIKDAEILQTFLKTELYKCFDTNQRSDFAGEYLIEGFMKGSMFHVNGIAHNGRIIRAWPFAYLHTCLSFAQEGKAYGNSSIPRSNPLHDRLLKTAQRLLDILPTPSDNLVFHLELFENLDENRAPNDDFVLCEIAARAPGASITHLIDLLSFSDDPKQSFGRLAFRASISLPIPTLTDAKEEICVTDLIVARKPGKLMYIPRECPIENLTYIPLADVDKPTEYEKYNVSIMNSACRFLAKTQKMEEGRELVEKGFEWYESVWINTAPDEPFTATLVKELHRYLHRKIFV